METIELNKWGKYQYYDFEEILKEYRKLEDLAGYSDLDDTAKTLRRNKQKLYREGREAALFSYGLSQAVVGEKIYFANCEDVDYDFVTYFKRDDVLHYTPVQLKEVVSEKLNSKSNLNETISKLAKYSSSSNLVVAIHLNKEIRLEFNAIEVQKLNIAQLWIFGALDETQDSWFIYGDMLSNPEYYQFNYPA
ncbi:MAG: hypothetical protein JXR79_03675 [Nitrospirae bacterium]|nr:hypothetical protein [Nitrospirota bacterium]